MTTFCDGSERNDALAGDRKVKTERTAGECAEKPSTKLAGNDTTNARLLKCATSQKGWEPKQMEGDHETHRQCLCADEV